MKKLFVTVLLGLAAVSGWAQGTVNFNNGGLTFKTVADRLVYLGQAGVQQNRLVGQTYVAALFYIPLADQNILGPTLGVQAGATAAFRAPTTATPGTWNNGTAGANRVLDGVPILGVATLQVRVWDSARFANFTEAYNAGAFGWSTPFNYTVPALGSTPDASYLNELRAFAVVPEPSTIALGVLGVAGLFLLRRRNK